MARAAVQRRLTWLLARLTDSRPEGDRVRRLVFDVPGWTGHLPGQHVDVRLTAQDGYRTQRSYSIASPPEQPGLHLLVEHLPGGEVSGYLTAEMQAGDALELRGPIGGYFIWSADADRTTPAEQRRPVQLVGGGAGVSPLLAMLDHSRRAGSPTPVRLLYSARTAGDVLGSDLLGTETTVTLTRGAPADWTGPTGRIDAALLQERAFGPAERPRIFVCGPTVFVETVATTLVELGHDPSSVRLERFGGAESPA
ncbi:ferredoxin reductase [Modestobacter excelsi]|uniref:ferredoxin reductase n=1 Tax=Modestobacter excelsi TaxID=2213161 RepID=UPI00110CE984|nr:ferredoxin reductase [Modestobacter excelsi]